MVNTSYVILSFWMHGTEYLHMGMSKRCEMILGQAFRYEFDITFTSKNKLITWL